MVAKAVAKLVTQEFGTAMQVMNIIRRLVLTPLATSPNARHRVLHPLTPPFVP